MGRLEIKKQPKKYDAIIVAVNHKPYKELKEEFFTSITSENAILVDVKGIYRNKIKKLCENNNIEYLEEDKYLTKHELESLIK